MIHATLIRQLTLSPSPESQGAVRYLSAASGMVVAGDCIYVVADDELHLAVFDIDGRGEGKLIRLFTGDLPDEPTARKAEKPDLEALVRLPPFTGYPYGTLLALASGSKPNRRTGVLLGLDSAGHIDGRPTAIDLSGMYHLLHSRFPALNIEGAVVRGPELILLHRGSKAHPANALVSFKLRDFVQGFQVVPSPRPPTQVHSIDLGTIEGSTLSFTDGAALPDGRIVFSAVAENTEDSYLDGPCLGAAIGIIGIDGRVETMQRLEPTEKVEGIHASVEGDRITLLLVTDADDAGAPAKLLSAQITA